MIIVQVINIFSKSHQWKTFELKPEHGSYAGFLQLAFSY